MICCAETVAANSIARDNADSFSARFTTRIAVLLSRKVPCIRRSSRPGDRSRGLRSWPERHEALDHPEARHASDRVRGDRVHHRAPACEAVASHPRERQNGADEKELPRLDAHVEAE